MNHLVLIWLALVGGSVLMGASIVALLISERTLEPVSAVSGTSRLRGRRLGFRSDHDLLRRTRRRRLRAASSGRPRSRAATRSPRRSSPTSRSARLPPRSRKCCPSATPRPRSSLLSELEPAVVQRASDRRRSRRPGRGGSARGVHLGPPLPVHGAEDPVPGGRRNESRAPRELTRCRRASGSVSSPREESPTSRPPRARAPTPCPRASLLPRSSRGSRTIVVAEAFVAESSRWIAPSARSMRFGSRSVASRSRTPTPLSGSSLCASLVVAKALAVAGDTASCGVVLVGQAQPVGALTRRRLRSTTRRAGS